MNTITPSIYPPSIYPVIVSFTKHFHAGFLKGLDYKETLHFVSRESAASWITGISANIAAGRLPYTLSNVKTTERQVAA